MAGLHQGMRVGVSICMFCVHLNSFKHMLPPVCPAVPAGAISYGLCSILLLTPLLGLLAVQLPFTPPSLALGLGVFCAMPTALSSGITFTQVLTP